MPEAANMSNHVENTSENKYQTDSNMSHESSSDDEVVLESQQFKPSTTQMQVVQQMYIPYIEGPKMEWTMACILPIRASNCCCCF